MPAIQAFKKELKLGKRILSKIIPIDTISIGHVVVEQYRSYEFPIIISLKREITGDEKEKLMLHLADEKVVLSQYGNPYRCYIRNVKFMEKLITATGIGIRI
jgi:hypothetical protein